MYPFLQWGVWAAGAGFQLLILLRLFRSRLFLSFPGLTVYFCWQVLRIAPTLFAYEYLAAKGYAAVYWLGEVVAWGLVFFVILELYNHALQDYQGLRRICQVFVCWAGVLLMLLVCGSVVFGSSTQADPGQWINTWLFLMQRSVRLIHAGLLLALMMFLGWFQVRSSPLLRYLMLGWLANSAITVAAAALRYRFGPVIYPVLNVAMPLSLLVILGGWYWALAESAAAEKCAWPARELTPDQATVLARRLELIEATVARAYR